MKPVLSLHNKTFVRYGIMAVLVVGIELASFWLFHNLFDWHYLLATWLSLLIGIILNWLGSRYYVFGQSKYPKGKEFGLVLLTSLVGVILQSSVVTLAVEIFSGPAMAGKVAAIIVTFFWNYFVRKKFIYKIVLDDKVF